VRPPPGRQRLPVCRLLAPPGGLAHAYGVRPTSGSRFFRSHWAVGGLDLTIGKWAKQRISGRQAGIRYGSGCVPFPHGFRTPAGPSRCFNRLNCLPTFWVHPRFRGDLSSGSGKRGRPYPPLPHAAAPMGLTACRLRAEATATAEGALELPSIQGLVTRLRLAWPPRNLEMTLFLVGSSEIPWENRWWEASLLKAKAACRMQAVRGAGKARLSADLRHGPIWVVNSHCNRAEVPREAGLARLGGE